MRFIFIAQKGPCRQYNDTAEWIDQDLALLFLQINKEGNSGIRIKNVILTDIS